MTNNKIVSLVASLILTLTITHRVIAQTPTPDNIGNTDIRDAIRQEVEKRLANTSSLPTNVAFVGTILGLQTTGSQLHIATSRQGDKIASVSAQSKIVRISPAGDSRIVKLDNAAPGDNIIAMGQINPDGTISAKRVILYTQTPEKRVVILGNIILLGPTALTIKPAKSDQEISFIYSGSTSRTGKLKIGDLVIVAASGPEDKTLGADLIVKLPSPTTPATSSADPTPRAKN